MYKIYNGEDLKFPSGRTATYSDLQSDPEYSILFNDNPVIRVENGITFEMNILDVLKSAYNVSASDPDDAINEINAAYNARKSTSDPINISDIQAQLDALAGFSETEEPGKD